MSIFEQKISVCQDCEYTLRTMGCISDYMSVSVRCVVSIYIYIHIYIYVSLV